MELVAKLVVDMDKAIDMSKSLSEGAIMLPDYKVGTWEYNLLRRFWELRCRQKVK